MQGPGIYDEDLTEIRENLDAKGAILIVIEGKKGSGFSCQISKLVTLNLPSILRQLADQIEKDIANETH